MDEASSIHILGQPPRNASKAGRGSVVYFMRPELNQILNVYGRMVAAGEWRDYAIDHLRDQAVFSIFRRASEMPLYRIIKEPALSQQQGAWRVIGMDGQVLKRGRRLDQLLRFFDRQLVKAVD
ncbi:MULTISPECIES: DUF2794 domain-containing protein [Kordiimonas]|uniref:DUF2794 domain-containing protein n=1 Tax=Kordiimonas TaxID=288021 RepID=UPI00257EBD2E|nr:DUF2794 domain-containing protein [Kordiimonas sp. UBA4487]